jgi:hypothetical protein
MVCPTVPMPARIPLLAVAVAKLAGSAQALAIADQLVVSRASFAATLLVGRTNSAALAVGDSEADLAMFKAATRSFAPANIGCSSAARLLGCEIVSEPYQRGLLQIAQRIGGSPAPLAILSAQTEHDKFLAKIFAAADLPLAKRLWRVLRTGNVLSILLR